MEWEKGKRPQKHYDPYQVDNFFDLQIQMSQETTSRMPGAPRFPVMALVLFLAPKQSLHGLLNFEELNGQSSSAHTSATTCRGKSIHAPRRILRVHRKSH